MRALNLLVVCSVLLTCFSDAVAKEEGIPFVKVLVMEKTKAVQIIAALKTTGTISFNHNRMIFNVPYFYERASNRFKVEFWLTNVKGEYIDLLDSRLTNGKDDPINLTGHAVKDAAAKGHLGIRIYPGKYVAIPQYSEVFSEKDFYSFKPKNQKQMAKYIPGLSTTDGSKLLKGIKVDQIKTTEFDHHRRGKQVEVVIPHSLKGSHSLRISARRASGSQVSEQIVQFFEGEDITFELTPADAPPLFSKKSDKATLVIEPGLSLEEVNKTMDLGADFITPHNMSAHNLFAGQSIRIGATLQPDGKVKLKKETIVHASENLKAAVKGDIKDVDVKDNNTYYTALIKASGKGDIKEVERLLANGVNVDAKDNNADYIPLIEASIGGYREIVELLISEGADVNAKEKFGNTALIRASYKGHFEIVKLLLGKGADVNAKNEYSGNTALIAASIPYYKTIHPFGRVVDYGDSEARKEVVKLLLEKGADVNAKNEDGFTALFKASGEGYIEVVKLLLGKNPEVNVKDKSGHTPLMAASFRGHAEIVKLLLESGANVDAKDNDGETALIGASYEGYFEIVKLLLGKGADVNVTNRYGGTALINASNRCDEYHEIIMLLLEKGADVNAKKNDGRTALFQASGGGGGGHIEVVKLLLGKDAEVNVKTEEGYTPLMIASFVGHAEIVKLLLESGANVDAKDNDGKTALDTAKHLRKGKDRTQIIKLLNAYGSIE